MQKITFLLIQKRIRQAQKEKKQKVSIFIFISTYNKISAIKKTRKCSFPDFFFLIVWSIRVKTIYNPPFLFSLCLEKLHDFHPLPHLSPLISLEGPKNEFSLQLHCTLEPRPEGTFCILRRFFASTVCHSPSSVVGLLSVVFSFLVSLLI